MVTLICQRGGQVWMSGQQASNSSCYRSELPGRALRTRARVAAQVLVGVEFFHGVLARVGFDRVI